MYARLISFSGADPEKRENAINTIVGTVIPMLREYDGYAGYIALWNKENASSPYHCFYTGPASTSDEAGEAQIVGDMLGKSDTVAIAISPSNAPLIANAIKAAKPKIPVMTLDADLKKEDAGLRRTYLGTDNYLMGFRLGEYLKKAKPNGGTVCLIEGNAAADNILRELRGELALPFAYKDKGIMAMIGRNAAVAEVGKHRHQVDGPVAFAAWLGVHAMLLSGAHSKTDAFLSWAWDYFDRDHAATVEASSSPHRIAWGEDEQDVPHISLDRPEEPATKPATA